MGLFLDYKNMDLLGSDADGLHGFLYNFLPEVVGFTLTLGFASCLRDRTDKTERADPPTGADARRASLHVRVGVGTKISRVGIFWKPTLD